MLQQLDRVTPENLTRLNREALRDRLAIRKLFNRLLREGTVLQNGINRKNEPRVAVVERVDRDDVYLRAKNFDLSGAPQAYFNFRLGGDQYFFAASPRGDTSTKRLHIELPYTIFRAERRDLFRAPPAASNGQLTEVRLESSTGETLLGRVVDCSLYGLGVEIRPADSRSLSKRLMVHFADGARRGQTTPARLCHSTPNAFTTGWVKIGLDFSEVAPEQPIPVERRDRILERGIPDRVLDRLALVGAGVRAVPVRSMGRLGMLPARQAPVPIVEFKNQRGQVIRAIADTYGDPRGAPAVVIPPAWGRTKETLLPLSSTIIETFRRAGEPVTVVRFDGTHRKGESYVDPAFRESGREYLQFTFSQAVRDIEATVDFLHSSEQFRPSTTILVTFSLAAVEGRRAVANDKGRRIGGWLSVVGMVDLQSALRTISGGIDYAYGLLRGVRFGHHELVGVVADMDHTGLDAIEHKLVFLEEARRDMATIDVPVTWIHGRHDAWMDLKRVREVMSCGATTNRKLIEVSTGHQLRSSMQALETFQMAAEEVSEMALGRRLRAAAPRLVELDRRRQAELARVPKRSVDLRAFWTDYLLGRDRRAGMELLTATAAYRNFMEKQIDCLQLHEGDLVADLGSGTGDFPLNLKRRLDLPRALVVDEVDYVAEALRRGQERAALIRTGAGVCVRPILGDLDVQLARRIPLGDERYDAVLASFLVTYLSRPSAFLREVYRILRPNGRLVLSSLKRDADISKIFVDGVNELAPRPSWGPLEKEVVEDFEELARDFLNDASRILDYEEEGRFRFWDARELADLVANAGFSRIAADLAFGDPPQAVVLRARKP